jgi:hypothetical protein
VTAQARQSVRMAGLTGYFLRVRLGNHFKFAGRGQPESSDPKERPPGPWQKKVIKITFMVGSRKKCTSPALEQMRRLCQILFRL